MSKSDRRSDGGAPCAVLLSSLLLLSALATGACKKSEEAPAAAAPEATTEAEKLDTTLTSAPPAPQEFTIIGRMPPQWDAQDVDVMVGPGDTISWKVGNGRHGVRFPVQADCDIALATMTFDPPLDPIPGGGCQSKTTNVAGAVIVTAKVNIALSGDLPYDCVVHRTAMPGTLKPK